MELAYVLMGVPLKIQTWVEPFPVRVNVKPVGSEGLAVQPVAVGYPPPPVKKARPVSTVPATFRPKVTGFVTKRRAFRLLAEATPAQDRMSNRKVFPT